MGNYNAVMEFLAGLRYWQLFFVNGFAVIDYAAASVKQMSLENNGLNRNLWLNHIISPCDFLVIPFWKNEAC